MAPVYTGNFKYSDTTWGQWAQGTGAITTAGSTWDQWILVTDCATTSSSMTIEVNPTWGNWHIDHETYVRDREAQEQAQAEHFERTARRSRIRELKARAAKRRARKLLLEHLDEQQTHDLNESGAFIVRSEHGRLYEIEADKLQHNVYLLDGLARNRIMEHCAHIPGHCPTEDNALAQKLMLETDEDAFLTVANSWDLRGGRRLVHESRRALSEVYQAALGEIDQNATCAFPLEEEPILHDADGFRIDADGNFIRDEDGNLLWDIENLQLADAIREIAVETGHTEAEVLHHVLMGALDEATRVVANA